MAAPLRSEELDLCGTLYLLSISAQNIASLQSDSWLLAAIYWVNNPPYTLYTLYHCRFVFWAVGTFAVINCQQTVVILINCLLINDYLTVTRVTSVLCIKVFGMNY